MRCATCGEPFIATRSDAVTCSLRCRMARFRLMQAQTPPFPTGRFDLFVVDLPLDWRDWSLKGEGRSPQAHYATQDIPALINLLTKLFDAVAAKNAVAAWWVYGPRLPESLQVLRATGWTYTTELLLYLKVTKDGAPRMGNGKTTRKVCENAWGAKRGKGIPRRNEGFSQLIVAPRGKHSEKPDAAYEALERLYGDVRRLDVFGRKRRDGWTLWGNDIEERSRVSSPYFQRCNTLRPRPLSG